MVGSVLVIILSLLGLLSFSFLIFFEANLCLVWFFLELAGLSIIPFFFALGGSVSVVSLFYYLIVSGISSGLLLSGILFPECVILMVLGLLIKFGIFPFFGWMYSVVSNSNWLVIWGFSTVLKSSFILISFFLIIGGSWVSLVMVFCCMSCMVASVLFWVYSMSWKICWAHMVLSSSSVLVYLCFSGSSLDSLFCVFFSYLLWSSLVILFFYAESCLEINVNNYFFFVLIFNFLILSFPVSLSIFYKICVCVNIFSCGIVFLFFWLFYSVSEQFYFLFSIIGVFGQKCSLSISFLI